MLWVALHFPRLSPGALEPTAAWACQFTPKVSLEPPQGLLLEVAGSLRLFGGVKAFLAALRRGLDGLGFDYALAVARTARTACWRARSGAACLEEVPLAACGLERETLEFLAAVGARSVGDLMRLPREGLAQRCGPGLFVALDQAGGAIPEPRVFFAPPARFAAQLELPGEAVHAEALLFGARRLLAQLEGLLAARQAGIRRFTVVLMHEQGVTPLEIGLASASRDAGRFAALLRERVERVALARPVTALRVEAADFDPLPGTSAAMFGDAAAETEGWARLLERLRARLGHHAVHGLALQPDHRPEHAWRCVEPGEWEPRAFRQPGPRPLWLLEAPRAVSVVNLELLAGPERIEAGWWDGDDARRDYFVARLPDSCMVWVYREAGEWQLHGLFA